MSRRRITASASARAIACGYWLDEAVALPVEPDLADVPDEELDDLERARRDGDALHALIEGDDGTDTYAIENCLDTRLRAAKLYLREHCPQGHEREQAFGYDGERARYLGVGREVYAAHPDCMVTGTADVVADLGGGHWLVSDWKSGEHGARVAAEQLRTLGALVLAAYGGEHATLHAVHLEHNKAARVFDLGSIDAMDGAALLHELHTRQPGPPVPGDHCGDAYCPLRGRCPAFVEAAAKLRPASLPLADILPATGKPATRAAKREHAEGVVVMAERRNPLVEGIVDDETARVAVDLLPLVERRIELLKADLRDYAERQDGGALDLGDGRRYAAIQQSRHGIDAKAALALAERAGAAKEDLAACLTSSSFPVWRRLGTRKAAS